MVNRYVAFATVFALSILLCCNFALAESQPGGGGGSGNTTPASSEIIVGVTYYNDPARLAENKTSEFEPNQTIYYTITVSNVTSMGPLEGNVTFYREMYEDAFQINGTYNGNFTVGSSDHSGWWYEEIYFIGNSGWNYLSEPHAYIVDAVLNSVNYQPLADLSCNPRYFFAPNDTVYLQVWPLDQAGQTIDPAVFSYAELFNSTNFKIYNKTYNENGSVINTTIYNINYQQPYELKVNCTIPGTNDTYENDYWYFGNVSLPDEFEYWYVYFNTSSVSNVEGEVSMTMPIFAANLALSPLSTLPNGTNVSVSFNGWVNARNETVYPSDNMVQISEYNRTCDSNGCNEAYITSYTYGSNVTSPFSFIFNKSSEANYAYLNFFAWIGNYNIGMWYDNARWNTTYPVVVVEEKETITPKGGGGGGGMSLPKPNATANTTGNQAIVNLTVENPAKPADEATAPAKNETKIESPTGMFLGNTDFVAAVQSFFNAIFSFFAKLFGF